MNFGTKIKELRTARGITLRTFAGTIGISPTYLSDLENSNRKPNYKLIDRFIDGLSASDREKEEIYDAIAESLDEIPLDIRLYLQTNNLIEIMRNISKADPSGETLKTLEESLKTKKR